MVCLNLVHPFVFFPFVSLNILIQQLTPQLPRKMRSALTGKVFNYQDLR